MGADGPAAGPSRMAATLPIRAERLVTPTVRAVDATGRPGQHTIRVAAPSYVSPDRLRNGSDVASIGAWPENGILRIQPGTDRNGRPSS